MRITFLGPQKIHLPIIGPAFTQSFEANFLTGKTTGVFLMVFKLRCFNRRFPHQSIGNLCDQWGQKEGTQKL